MISFIIPSYNNLKHLKNVYASIQKHAPQAEVILLDDGSTDGTWEWIQRQDCIKYKSEERVGHTILYDKGIDMATNDIVGILHADMIIGPNYVENMIKHLKPGTVVCATRIEPPLHPLGKEKIIQNFGTDFDSLDIPAFESFVSNSQNLHTGEVTKGMFAPWILYKKDFQAIGGHDPLFAPFPYEDSDIFQRWILNGYNLIQSRDSFVYHLTCRGHRWNDQVGKDDEYYKIVSHRASRNYLRKWGSWIKNNEYQYPIIPKKYNTAFIIHNCNLLLLEALEPWCDRIYVNEKFNTGGRAQDYIEKESENTSFDLSKRVLNIKENDPYSENDIILEFDALKFSPEAFNIIQNLSDIITESGEVGEFELDIFKVTIHQLVDYSNEFIHI
jgi:glycosyltransferase involved in cell wall biosynthesis